jgi:predicted nucleic acid-binding protein
LIAYFDTSAVLPLLVAEEASAKCIRLWNDSERVVSARLMYPEARAGLARAERQGRITSRQTRLAVRYLDDIEHGIDHVEITSSMARRAGQLAHDLGLRAYDAVHLAAALVVADDQLVLVAGDGELIQAGLVMGLMVAPTT